MDDPAPTTPSAPLASRPPREMTVEEARDEMIALAIELSQIEGREIKGARSKTPSSRTLNGHARQVISEALHASENRVRDWFVKNPVPDMALIAMRAVVARARMGEEVSRMAELVRNMARLT